MRTAARQLYRSFLSSSSVLWRGAGRRSYYDYSPEPFQPIFDRQPNWLNAEEAVGTVKSGDKVFVHGVAATPTPLLEALCARALTDELTDVKLYHLHLTGNAKWAQEDAFEGKIRSVCFHISDNMRAAVNRGRADCMSIFLSEIPLFFKRKVIELDMAIIQCSTPDQQGYCSLGTNVDCTRAAIKNAKKIIGLCNPQMPRTFGDGMIHASHFDALVYDEFPLPDYGGYIAEPTEEEVKVGELIAGNLVADGATLQFGIGRLPQAIVPLLKDHQHLGIHTEQFGDSLVELIEKGVVTNSMKKVLPGKVVGTFCVGTPQFYEYVHDNPLFMMCDVLFTNDQQVIRENPKVTSINTAISIDLTGQICADSIGDVFYSGFGGQLDFVQGASLCHDGLGKAVICMLSKSRGGHSKIVPTFDTPANVVTTRGHAKYLVTEYGIAELFGKNFRQRAHELIRVAHPDFREGLEKAAFQRLKVMPAP